MEKLIQELISKAGLSEEQAAKTVETVNAFLKERVPSGFRSQIDNLLKGETLTESVKESLMDTAVDVKEKVEDVLKEVTAKTGESVENLKQKLSDMWNKKKGE